MGSAAGGLKIGWAQTDMTPPEPVLLAGQFHARVSEGVRDPITATALAIEGGGEMAVFVSCDLVSISTDLCTAVRARLAAAAPGVDPLKVVLHATHTHCGPEMREPVLNGSANLAGWPGVDLPVMTIEATVAFAAERLAAAVGAAWRARTAGQVAFGQGYAVVGRNRRWVNQAGTATMYGKPQAPDFDRIEGYEDHAVNVVATQDVGGRLTGLIVNLACPSQETEHLYELSADYWHETRLELRRRFGAELPILAQCSAAGELTPHLLYDKAAHERMLRLKGRSAREELAARVADSVTETLGWIQKHPAPAMPLRHEVLSLTLPLAVLTPADVTQAEGELARWQTAYANEITRLDANPALRREPRWYVTATQAHRRMNWYRGVVERYGRGADATQAAEVHVIRLGELVWATNPFELYLDFGIAIKVRSPAVQTLLVQLAGPGTYVPSARSVAGGGYGSIPASNPVGPEGGRQLVAATLAAIDRVWQ